MIGMPGRVEAPQPASLGGARLAKSARDAWRAVWHASKRSL